jgi:hypothetical protein
MCAVRQYKEFVAHELALEQQEWLDYVGASRRRFDQPLTAEARARHEKLVDEAIRAGRILARDRELWLKRFAANEADAKAALAEQRAFQSDEQVAREYEAEVASMVGLSVEELL